MPGRGSRQSGYMLVELLVTMTLLLAVSAAILGMLETGIKDTPKVTEQTVRLNEARQSIDQMVRELRQAYSIVSTGSQSVDFLTCVREGTLGSGETPCLSRTPGTAPGYAVPRRVAYDCTTGNCIRYETTADPTITLPSSGKRVASGVQNSDIFTYSPSTIAPTAVHLKMVFSISGQNRSVNLSDGAELRNVNQ